MRRIALPFLVLVLTIGCQSPTQPDSQRGISSPNLDGKNERAPVVTVAAPTGDPTIDRPHILEAVAAATAGAVIQFRRGAYALALDAPIITVSVPGVTLQGDSRGTTILGLFNPHFPQVVFRLNGGNQAVRGLTFEGFRIAVQLEEPATPTGGYRVENSIFRNGNVPIRMFGTSDNVSTIEGNQFINVTFAFLIFGKTVNIRGNRTTSPSLADHPFGVPFNAGVLASDVAPCENAVLEENTVIGNADGFILFSCRNSVIRENTFIDQRLFPGDGTPSDDDGSMVVGLEPGFQGNLIEENELRGSHGMGIIIEEGSGNRIVENRFRDLVPGDLAPIHATLLGLTGGTGILLGGPTSGNVVRENKFRNVTTPLVDLGSGNITAGQDLASRPALRFSVTGKSTAVLDHSRLRKLHDIRRFFALRK